LAKTYGARRFFVITPLEDQVRLAERIIKHWTTGFGAAYNHDRKVAMELVETAPSIDEAVDRIQKREGQPPLLIATDAGDQGEKALDYAAAAKIIRSGQAVFLLFGTAWGFDREVFEKADYILEPIKGIDEYNHLSVRAAAAIIIDRLVVGSYG
jgi:tRNA (guanine37-N1)-methyltransferase